MEVRFLFEGILDKCTYEHGKKDWKRRHFVFKHILASNIRSLEFYAAGTKNWRKTEPKGVLALYPGYEILKVHEPKRQFAFEIKTVDHVYRLAAHSEDELNQWILILERESIVNSFCVEPEVTDHLTRLGATDTCHLHVANSELRLLCAKDGRLLVAWPFTCLRRYMSTRGKFTVEAGRRAPTGEGKFTFLTPQHDEIYKLLDSTVKSRASHKPTGISSHDSLRKTQSVPIAGTASTGKDMPENGYDHLATTPVSSATEHQLTPGMSNSLKNTYSAPYGHLPSRDTTKTALPLIGHPQAVPENRSSVESEEGDQYNTLTQPEHGANEQGRYGVGEDGYNILGKRQPSSNQDGQDMYNVLDHGPKPRSTSQHQQQVTDDVYNVIGETVLHPVPPLGGSQAANEDVYNTLSTSQRNSDPFPTVAPEETYNTLEHGSPARSPHRAPHHTTSTESQGSAKQPKPTARKLFEPATKQPPSVLEGNDTHGNTRHPLPPPVRKTPEQVMVPKSESVDEGDEMYNTLDTAVKIAQHPGSDTRNTARRPPPPPLRKTPESVDEGDEMYNTLDMPKPRSPAPSVKPSGQIRKLQKSQSLSVDESGDMYNTLDTGAKIAQPPVVPKKTHMNKQTPLSANDSDEMYNTLDTGAKIAQPPVVPRKTHMNKQSSLDSEEMYNTLETTRVSTPPIPARQKSTSSTMEGNDMYNTLDTARAGSTLPYEGTDNEMAASTSRNDDDMYNALDTMRTGSSLSVPVPPQRSFTSHGGTSSPVSSPGKRDSPELKRNSTPTMRCPLDSSPSLSRTRQQASSLDDLDSYASIDYAALSPPKGAFKHPPIPAQRSGPSKLGRKTSAPDVLSFAGNPSAKEFKKPVKGGLVSNLRASLEAGGLDLTKLQRKPKKLSREESEDLCPYAEVVEQGASQVLSDDVFVSGTSPTKPARSQSSPSEGKPGEDIYDELDQTAQVRPKSLQITKAKKNAKK